MPFLSPGRIKRPSSRFRLYNNPLSKTWRADILVPAIDPLLPSGHAYVGTLTRAIGANGLATYSGPITALDSSVLRRDAALKVGSTVRGVFVCLAELAPTSARQRVRYLAATIVLASGKYQVEARYNSGDAQIVGRIRREPGTATVPGTSTRPPVRRRKRRPRGHDAG